MRKNIGNSVVKKAISLAMALMLLALTPVTNVSASNLSDEANTSEEYQLNDKEKEILSSVGEDFKTKVDTTNGAKTAIDDAYKVANEDAQKVMDSVSAEAQKAADEAEKVKDDAATANESAQSYKKALDDYTNADAALIGNEGVYSIDYIPENKDNDINDAYNNSADIKIKVDDSTQSLVKYTDEKKEIAKEAAKEATEIANNVNANTNIADAAQKIADAKKAATDAVNDATKAYDSAVEALDAEIIIYNSYITAFYSEEEAKALLKKDSTGAYTTHSDIVANLMNKADMDEALLSKNLDAQKAAIDCAEKVVDDCQRFTLTNAKDALAQIEKADKSFIETLNSIIEQSTYAIEKSETITPGTKEYDQMMSQLESAKTALSYYLAQTKNQLQNVSNIEESQKIYSDKLIDLINYTQDKINEYDGKNPEIKDLLKGFYETIKNGATGILNWYTTSPVEVMGSQESVNYGIDTANKLIDNLIGSAEDKYDGIFGEANKKVDDAKATYVKALELYNQYKAEYEAANLVSKFGTLKNKLDSAEADLLVAKTNFDAAVSDLKAVEDAKKEFDNVVSNISNSVSGTTTTTTNSSSTTTSNTPNSSTVTLSDETTPLAVTPDIIVANITDENVALDSVPKTGDSLPASVPVACASFLAFIGAALINLKRRFFN